MHCKNSNWYQLYSTGNVLTTGQIDKVTDGLGCGEQTNGQTGWNQSNRPVSCIFETPR